MSKPAVIIPTPRTDADAYMADFTKVEIVDADFARKLERELTEAREEAEMWRTHIKTCLSYPRGSEAQVRCLEEVGQDAAYLDKQHAKRTTAAGT